MLARMEKPLPAKCWVLATPSIPLLLLLQMCLAGVTSAQLGAGLL